MKTRLSISKLFFALLLIPSALSSVALAEVDRIATIHYHLDCSASKNPLPIAVPGFLKAWGETLRPQFEDKKQMVPMRIGQQIRFMLPEVENSVDVFLTGDTQNYEVVMDKKVLRENYCAFQLDSTTTQSLSEFARSKGILDSSYDLALRYSPFIVIRADQLEDNLDDVPLKVAYSATYTTDVENGKLVSRLTLIYTDIFSAEKNTVYAPNETKKLTRYGRQSDIEYSLKQIFRLVPNNKKDGLGNWVLEKTIYHSGVVMGVGGKDNDFDGKYFHGTHPILYNDSRVEQNLFCAHGNVSDFMTEYDDAVYKKYYNFWCNFDPKLANEYGIERGDQFYISFPQAREDAEFDDSFVSDYAAWRAIVNGKGNHKPVECAHKKTCRLMSHYYLPEDYLYIAYTSPTPEDFTGEFHWTWNSEKLINHQWQWKRVSMPGSYDRNGEDLFHHTSVSAIALPEGELDSFLKGRTNTSYLSTERTNYSNWSVLTNPLHFNTDSKINLFKRERQANRKLKRIDVSDHFHCRIEGQRIVCGDPQMMKKILK